MRDVGSKRATQIDNCPMHVTAVLVTPFADDNPESALSPLGLAGSQHVYRQPSAKGSSTFAANSCECRI
jgi:hypothetical protein